MRSATRGKPTNPVDIDALAVTHRISPGANGLLLVDLGALTRNYRKLKSIAAPAECASVVKANAYGLGVAQVAPTLYAEGCRTFFVATLAEALSLRSLLPRATIYVLNGLPRGCAEEFARAKLIPVLGTPPEIEEWAAYCRTHAPHPATIQIDTGMNRLGLKVADCRTLRKSNALTTFSINLVMSHLACGDDASDPMNARQRATFLALASELPPARRSLAASGGIFLGPDFRLDLVRPGIALYGGNPFSTQSNPMEPVIRLFGRIAAIGEAEVEETVGYGATRMLTRRTRYATVSVGYADGYFRALGAPDRHEGGCAYIGEHRIPLLGRVSMDLIVFDVTDVPEAKLERGGFVELLGPRFTVEDAATRAGTINYEVLTSLGPRYHRIYIGAKSGE
jgi:alanine racemase